MINKNTVDSINESGIVIKCYKNKAVVELYYSNSEQDGKKKCDTCGARVLCIPADNGKRVINAYNTLNAKVGNKVVIKEDENTIFKLSMLQYGIPLLGFLTGLLGFYIIAPDTGQIPAEIIHFLGGILGLGISGIIVKYLLSQIIRKKKVDTIFSIVKIIQ